MDRFNSIAKLDVSDTHPIRVFDKFWHDHVSDENCVLWSTFRPMNMACVLPWMMVLDCLPNDEYRYRLCGTGCEQLLGVNLTGQIFGTNVRKKWAEKTKQEFSAIKAGKGPCYSKGNLPVRDREFIEVHRAVYGFSTNGIDPNRIMAIIASTTPSRLSLVA